MFRMNPKTVWLIHSVYARSAESVYRLVHTTDYAIGESDFTFKAPIPTLRFNLMVLQQ